jgi:MYXO-CTERM domain-containing protein
MGHRAIGCVLGLLLAIAPTTAWGTWSLVAVDPDTQEVGVSVASCVPAPFGTTILPQVAGVVPGIGALAAQAQFDQSMRDLAVDLLAEGNSPQEVIDMVTANDFGAQSRQYGVVTLDLQTATFTGAAAQDWAGSLEGTGVTGQGNILYGPEVVADAVAEFEARTPECPYTLADRLMAALEAGAAQGGDNRCSEEQSALAAVLIVARPGDPMDAPYIDLRIASQPQGGSNPVDLLRESYDAWRIANPPDDSRCQPAGTTGAAEDSGDGATSTAGADTGSGSATDGGETTAPASTSSAASTGTGGDTATPPMDEDEAGCGCRSTGAAPAWWLAVILLVCRRRPIADLPDEP